jgi:excisionase family DNA binding protein
MATRLAPIHSTADEIAVLRRLDADLSREAASDAEIIGPSGARYELPSSVYRLLREVVHELAMGNAVSVVPVAEELTTQQAADLLNISRPFLIKLLETGEIPFYLVGVSRRISVADVLAYRQRRNVVRRAAIEEIAREAQNMGLYD